MLSARFFPDRLNILVVGTESGQVHLFAYGVFPVGVVDLSNSTSSVVCIVEANKI